MLNSRVDTFTLRKQLSPHPMTASLFIAQSEKGALYSFLAMFRLTTRCSILFPESFVLTLINENVLDIPLFQASTFNKL